MTVEKKVYVQSPLKNDADPTGIETATYGSPVGRASDWATEDGQLRYEPQSQETYFLLCDPEKIQISLHIRTVWSESSLGAFRIVYPVELLKLSQMQSFYMGYSYFVGVLEGLQSFLDSPI